ncbi:DUF4232 domain-containing protein [Streptomyces ficellus]|uniref:DUF4232 domain-containing protein n=1 Tax=Streptomyces ficellus TaxID=1977088 RepID=A0A6I6FDY5_9ACTN|nr:DUF4232 domain-containing protein [Streptomyces ficellus]QGV79217.1 DUF4232 domain-containing protein [Streptomyces ficellus]
MRTFRIRTTAAAATAVLAALSLTACLPGQEPQAANGSTTPAGSPSPAATAQTPGGAEKPASPAPSGKSSSDAEPATNGGSGKGGATSAADDDSDPQAEAEACGADVKVTYTTLSRPLNHALLTMTNTGSTACDAYHAPLLRFDDAQSVTAVNEGSKPQSVVRIGPGESAYAAINLAVADGSGTHGGTAEKLAVHFAPRSGEGSTDDAPAAITLPKDTYVDSSTNVTYWQSSMDAALGH